MLLLPPKPLIFIDSSVLFSAALSPKGSANDLIRAGIHDEVDLVISLFVLTETERNLSAKAARGLEGFHAFRDSGVLRIAEPTRALVLQVAQHIELKDAAIVAGALSAGALILASYDRKHLLAHAPTILERFSISVMTPASALALIKQREAPG